MSPKPRRAPRLPWRGRLLNVVGAARRLVRDEPYLDSEQALDFARRDTALDDLGERFDPDTLELLLASARSADLTFLGRRSFHNAVGTALAVRLLYVELRKQRPSIFDAPIVPPLIVTGPPRSGTTLLQNLLALHPDFDPIPNWELLRPISPAMLKRTGRDRRREIAVRWDETADKYLPRRDHIHFRRADTPGECILLMMPTLRSYAFIGMAPIHDFMAELRECDGHVQYDEYAELLQILQHARPHRPMVLKAPAHTPYIDRILERIPEAMIVTTQRDLVTTTTSLLSLHRTGYSTTTRSYDARKHALAVLSMVRSGLRRYSSARATYPDRIHDVFYQDLVADPTTVVRGIYRRFGVPWPEGHEERIEAYLRANPKGKHGPHRYEPSEFGVTEDEIRDQLSEYQAHMPGSGG